MLNNEELAQAAEDKFLAITACPPTVTNVLRFAATYTNNTLSWSECERQGDRTSWGTVHNALQVAQKCLSHDVEIRISRVFQIRNDNNNIREYVKEYIFFHNLLSTPIDYNNTHLIFFGYLLDYSITNKNILNRNLEYGGYSLGTIIPLIKNRKNTSPLRQRPPIIELDNDF